MFIAHVLWYVIFKSVGLFACASAVYGAREFAWTNWAVATPGAGGVGRLRSRTKWGRYRPSTCFVPVDFCAPSLAKHLNTLGLAGRRGRISGENWGETASHDFSLQFSPDSGFPQMKTDSESPHFAARNTPTLGVTDVASELITSRSVAVPATHFRYRAAVVLSANCFLREFSSTTSEATNRCPAPHPFVRRKY